MAAALGVIGASFVIKQVLIRTALEQEASHFWSLQAENPDLGPPDTANMKGYLLGGASSIDDSVPAMLRQLEPGFYPDAKEMSGAIVLVEASADKRLVLIFKQEQVNALAFWFGIVPLAVVLIVVYVIAWIAYRISKRAVSPMIWLATQVQQWDPRNPDPQSLHTERLPVDMSGETLLLAKSLYDFAFRISEFSKREHNFTRDASHELRTPLAIIRMATEIIEADKGVPECTKRSLSRIQSATRDMECLIEAFLIMAREGDVGLANEMVSAAEIAKEEIEKVRPLVCSKPITMDVDIQQDFSMEAPSRVLSVLLGNLLRNSGRYTDAGRIVVQVKPGQIVVSDTGIGISPSVMANIFEPFVRAEIDRGGQGIGMTIVKRLVDRYGWRISLKSDVGKGTEVTVFCPQFHFTENNP